MRKGSAWLWEEVEVRRRKERNGKGKGGRTRKGGKRTGKKGE